MRKRWGASREERLALHGGVAAAVVFLVVWVLLSFFIGDALPVAFAIVFVGASLVWSLALWRGRPLRDPTVLTYGGAAVGAVITLLVLRLIVAL